VVIRYKGTVIKESPGMRFAVGQAFEAGEPRGSANFRPGPNPGQGIPTMARAERKSS
jgi:hypothetical protein